MSLNPSNAVNAPQLRIWLFLADKIRALWPARAQQALPRELAKLSAHLLYDIGVDPRDVRSGEQKPASRPDMIFGDWK
jgi:uncharacterized protein YjiS (DUF1127 family)